MRSIQDHSESGEGQDTLRCFVMKKRPFQVAALKKKPVVSVASSENSNEGLFLSGNLSPSSTKLQNKVGDPTMKISAVRQQLLVLQRRIEAGLIPGVKLDLMDVVGCRFIAVCIDVNNSMRRVRLTLSFTKEENLNTTMLQFAILPLGSSDFLIRDSVEVMRSSLHRMIARRSPNLAESCLRKVVSLLSPSRVLDEDVAQQNMFSMDMNSVTRHPIVASHEQPCPRFSGASFSGSGLLVYYNSGISSFIKSEVIPRSLSDLNSILHSQDGIESNSDTDGSTSALEMVHDYATEELGQGDLYDEFLRAQMVDTLETEDRPPLMKLNFKVSLLNVSCLTGMFRYLGRACEHFANPKVALPGKEDLCWYDDWADVKPETFSSVELTNMRASAAVGRLDLIQVWLSIGLLRGGDSIYPSGHLFLRKLFEEYSKLKDVQTLGLLAVLQTIKVDLNERKLMEGFRRAYSKVLEGWGLNIRRTEILKGISETKEDTMIFAPKCCNCGEITDGLCKNELCRSKGRAMKCVVCNIGVRGLSTVCFLCGHGGHAIHMHDWFSHGEMSSIPCPSGCGCFCGNTLFLN